MALWAIYNCIVFGLCYSRVLGDLSHPRHVQAARRPSPARARWCRADAAAIAELLSPAMRRRRDDGWGAMRACISAARVSLLSDVDELPLAQHALACACAAI